MVERKSDDSPIICLPCLPATNAFFPLKSRGIANRAVVDATPADPDLTAVSVVVSPLSPSTLGEAEDKAFEKGTGLPAAK